MYSYVSLLYVCYCTSLILTLPTAQYIDISAMWRSQHQCSIVPALSSPLIPIPILTLLILGSLINWSATSRMKRRYFSEKSAIFMISFPKSWISIFLGKQEGIYEPEPVPEPVSYHTVSTYHLLLVSPTSICMWPADKNYQGGMSAGANSLVDAGMFLACGHFLMAPHVETKSEFVHE